jgi:transcriptional regulator with XRE-family HTH domain
MSATSPEPSVVSEPDVSSVDVVLGSRVRRLRAARQMSQADLGQRLGVSAQQIQKYERGANRISAATLISLAIALGVPSSDLVSGIGDDSPAADSERRVALTPQGSNLLDAFARIDSAEVRAALVTLTTVLARASFQ